MERNEEGGVCTQKLNLALLAVGVLLIAGCAVVLDSEDSTAESVSSGYVTLSDSNVKEGADLTATIMFEEQDTAILSGIEYTAKLTNSSGSTQSSAVTPSSGSLDNKTEQVLAITAPSTAGKYTLTVEFTESYNDGTDDKTVTVTKTLTVSEPITLSVTINNSEDATVSFAGTVYFYVDGVKMEDSSTDVSIAPGSSQTVTYEFFDKNLSSGKHTFYVMAGEHATLVTGLGEKQTFYYDQDTQDYFVYIMAIMFIIVLIVLIWVLRKPVKNYGKPKARR